MYRPMEHQKEIHKTKASEVVVIGGNRSGKSLCTFIEDARAACGSDPHGKYPEENGILAIIGRDWKHIGMVVYPMLFKAGAFYIIKDLKTGDWRAYDPEVDEPRKSERKPAPPMIPPRMIKKISWLLKSSNYIQSCELINGWVIYFQSSESEPSQGWQADRIHIDEDVVNEAWLPEMQARLADRKGVLCWSAMPHSRNDALNGLSERAEQAEIEGRDNIKMFRLKFLANKYIDSEEKQKNVERWSALGQDVLRMRSEGEFVTDSVLCYPNFAMHVHGYEWSDLPQNAIPDDWCRYVAIDPGHVVTAAIFGVVPPDESMLLIYDQLYIRQCNALIFGEKFEQKVKGHKFHAFIIDMHGGRIRDIGSGQLPVEMYSHQLRERNIASEVTGSSFMAGCDDIQARMASVRNYMHIRPSGSPKLRILKGTCPDLEREMKRYKKKVFYKGGTYQVTDAPNTRGEVHACQCLEYLCATEPKYHQPKVEVGPEPWYVDWMKRRRKRQSQGDNAIYLAPQGSRGADEF